MSDKAVIFTIIACAVGLFVWGRLPVMFVALCVPLALFFTGLLPLDMAFSGFGDTVIVFIAGLFVVAAGLEATGVTAFVGQWLSRVVGSSPLKLSVLTVLIVALLAPLISMSGAVAALVPVVTLLALRMKEAPSKFLMPLAFASGAGSKLALTGTPKNVLVSDAASDAGYGHFGFFEFAWVGVPLLLGTVLIVALIGRRLLPVRTPANLPEDFGQHAQTLAEQYGIGKGTALYRIESESLLVGKTREAIAASAVSLVAVSKREASDVQSATLAPATSLCFGGLTLLWPDLLPRTASRPWQRAKAPCPTCCSTSSLALPKW